MKIYRPESHGVQNAYVAPGSDHPETSDFMQDGKPRTFTVTFFDGVADVPAQIGCYMVNKGLAQDTPILLPKIEVIHA